MKKIAFTTGGTGGHIYPALSLAKRMREEGYEIIFIGTEHRMEKNIVPAEKFKFYGLDVVPIKSISSIFKMLKAIISAYKILKIENVDTVIGFGNYISIPSIIAGKLLKAKIYLQEQNILMGLANKYGYRIANKVFLAFEETLKHIPSKYHYKFIVTGNPLREEFYNISKEEARKKLEIDMNDKVILVMGGSLGAKPINEAVISNVESINRKNNFKLFWSTGDNLFKETFARVKDLKNIVLMPYFDNVPELMAASDVVISRSGASTISELIQLEKPSILIPYNYVGQKDNAEMLEYASASKSYTNEDANRGVKEAISLCYQEDILDFMTKNIKKLNKGNAVDNILKYIKEDE